LSQDRLIEFIDYIIKEPTSEDHNIGYKFPFNACEVLCSENVYVINKLLENSNKKEEVENSNKNSDEIEEGEFSGRKSIIMPFGNKQKEEGEENIKETDDLYKDIMHMDNTHKEVVNGAVNACKERMEENEGNNCKEDDKNFLDSLESKEDVLSVTKEPETSDNKISNISPEYPLINHLFTLLKNDCSLNYVLAGYFYKFFNHVTQFRTNIFMTYLLIHKTSFINDMIKHLNRKSIADCVLKVLVSYVPDIQDAEIKKEILEKVIDSFNNNDEEVIKQISLII
jgi:hypothetical protein